MLNAKVASIEIGVVMKIRYFKPRKDLEYSGSLLPQKLVGNQQSYLVGSGSLYRWRESDVPPRLDLLAANFIEVDTEEEAIEGY